MVRLSTFTAASLALSGMLMALHGSAKAQSTGGQTLVVNLGYAPSQFGMNFQVTAVGSGTNGPQTAAIGVNIFALKKGFFTPNAGVGELDGASIFLRQDGPNSDGSGLLINAQNTGHGFISATEYGVSSLDVKTNTVTHAVDIQEGGIIDGGNAYGFVATTNAGVSADAVLIQNNGSSTWYNILHGLDAHGHSYYLVDGQGNSYQDGTMRPGSRMVSQLPQNCTPGDKLNAADGRKVSEGSGSGSGVPVVCELVSRNSTQTTWFSEFSGTVVEE